MKPVALQALGCSTAECRTDLSTASVLESISNGADNTADGLRRELVLEMRRRWQLGERPLAESFLSQYPELHEQAETAVDLIYEEYCLRQATNEGVDASELLRRFPQWAGPLRVMLDCHQLLLADGDLAADTHQFPSVGDAVGGFRLLEELGRGSRGRVFLATQTGLADRSVVLKITPLEGSEHLLLARLQHTSIVPLHTVLDDHARGIRILCMPFFGRLTLAALLDQLSKVPLALRTGEHIVEAIDRGLHAPVANSSAARQMLAHVSYTQAFCWITASLADALQLAHERDLVHFDIKPANVLLATDGQPMLLDFHLARPPILPDGPAPDRLGGVAHRVVDPDGRDLQDSTQRGNA